jgi:hypothetical protein
VVGASGSQKFVLHIDDQNRGALAEADALPHALFSVELGRSRFGIGHGDELLSCRGQGIAIT